MTCGLTAFIPNYPVGRHRSIFYTWCLPKIWEVGPPLGSRGIQDPNHVGRSFPGEEQQKKSRLNNSLLLSHVRPRPSLAKVQT